MILFSSDILIKVSTVVSTPLLSGKKKFHYKIKKFDYETIFLSPIKNLLLDFI